MPVFFSWCDIVTEGQAADKIADNEILISLEGFVLATCALALLEFKGYILHGALGLLVMLAKYSLEQAFVFGLITANVVNGHLFEYHFVLS